MFQPEDIVIKPTQLTNEERAEVEQFSDEISRVAKKLKTKPTKSTEPTKPTKSTKSTKPSKEDIIIELRKLSEELSKRSNKYRVMANILEQKPNYTIDDVRIIKRKGVIYYKPHGFLNQAIRDVLKEEGKKKRAEQMKEYWNRFKAYKEKNPQKTLKEIRTALKNKTVPKVEIEAPLPTLKRTQHRTVKNGTLVEDKIDMAHLNVHLKRVLEGEAQLQFDYTKHLDVLYDYIKGELAKEKLPIKIGVVYRAFVIRQDSLHNSFDISKEDWLKILKQIIAEADKVEFPVNRQILVQISNSNEIDEALNSIFHEITKSIQEYLGHGSGYILSGSDCAFFKIAQVRRSGSSYVEFPAWMKNKKFAINIKNKDNKCFLMIIQQIKIKKG
jgi:RNAse (barnase) inhibitor barstar